MLRRLNALVLCCGALLQCTGAIRHHILTKSWHEAQEDCLAYLCVDADRSAHFRAEHYGVDALTKQLVFCIALNLRVYEPARNAVRVEMLSRFFCPDPADSDNVERTNECLRKVGPSLSSNGNSCRTEELHLTATETVFEAFRCCYHHYGNLIRVAVPLPPTALELDQVQQECALIVALPLELLRDRLRLRVHPNYDRLRRTSKMRFFSSNSARMFSMTRTFMTQLLQALLNGQFSSSCKV
uniref:Uncharacterized protein n=1 Tax=Anopheles atroparvus TaxID=41427 RepID=A0A182JLS3_ANOAO